MRKGRYTAKILRSIKPKGVSIKTGRVSPLNRKPRSPYTKRKSFKLK